MNPIDKLAKYKDSHNGTKASWQNFSEHTKQEQNSTNIYSILPLKGYCKKYVVLKLTLRKCVDITAKVCY